MAAPTPLGVHQIASDETYALVADLNRVGITADAAIAFVKARAEYLTDKAVADAGALSQRALNELPGRVVAEVDRVIGDTREDAAEALETAEEAKALAVSTTAPTADAVNAVLVDPDTSAGATFATKADAAQVDTLETVMPTTVKKRELHLNLADFGATPDPTGTIMSDAAFAEVAKVIAAEQVRDSYFTAHIHLPRGRINVSGNGVLNKLNTTPLLKIGLHISGEGMFSSILHMTGVMDAEKWFYDNGVGNRKFSHITCENMGFSNDGVEAKTPADPRPKGGVFKVWSAGHEKFFKFNRVAFDGWWNRIYETHGTGNADHWTFSQCDIKYVLDTIAYLNNAQSVDHSFDSCNVVTCGSVLTTGPQGGGSAHFYAGSWVLRSSIDPSERHAFIRLLDGSPVHYQNGEFSLSGIKTEIHSSNQGLVYCGTGSRADVTMDGGCNFYTMPGPTGPRNLVTVSPGSVVRIRDSMLPHEFAALVKGGNEGLRATRGGSMLQITDCSHGHRLSDNITVERGGRAIVSGSSLYSGATTDVLRGVGGDFDLGWQKPSFGQPGPTTKRIVLKPETDYWPGETSAPLPFRLPRGAVITGLVAVRGADSTLGTADYQLLLRGGGTTGPVLASSPLQPKKDPINWRRSDLWIDTTAAGRDFTITGNVGSTAGAAPHPIVVEYL